jgi:hypothetical protein
MSFLQTLQKALPSNGDGPLFPLDPLTEIKAQIDELTRQLKERTPRAPEDAILEAVERFVQHPRFRDSRDALLVTLGCDRPVGAKRYRLIEDDARFPAILVGVDRFRRHLFVFKDCYKGLLDTYLGYHPEMKGGSPKAKPNWESLRAWLKTGISDIRDPEGLEEGWVVELVARPELFSDKPVQTFGREILDGDEGAFLQFQCALAIPETSWLMEQLVLAQIRAAGESRAGVAAYVPKLLRLLETLSGRNPPVFNLGLTELLTYYQAQSGGTPHLELRDFSVGFWGNPVDEKDSSGWVHVPEKPREMVESWVKLHIIQQFFNVLAKQGNLEENKVREKRQRRLKFWEQYADVVGDVKFALGPHARTSTDRRMVEVLELMAGLTLDLQGGGDRQNNAFIMRFGDWVVVEFGLENNACFFYRASDLPFERGDSYVSAQAIRNHITSSSYSQRGAIRLVHHDSGGRTWEENFTFEMEKRGIFRQRKPSGASANSTARWTSRFHPDSRMVQVEANSRAQQPAGKHSSVEPSETATRAHAGGANTAATSNMDGQSSSTTSWRTSVDRFVSAHANSANTSTSATSDPIFRLPFGPTQEKSLRELCRKLDIQVLDMRERGSYLWIALDKDEDTRLTPLLKSYGFKYRPGRGWYGQHSS